MIVECIDVETLEHCYSDRYEMWGHNSVVIIGIIVPCTSRLFDIRVIVSVHYSSQLSPSRSSVGRALDSR